MIRKYVIELEDTVKGFSENVEYLERVFGAEELHTGYWKIIGKTTMHYACSVCGTAGDSFDKFCKHCGLELEVSND